PGGGADGTAGGRRPPKIEPRRDRRRSPRRVGTIGLPSRIQPCASAVSWQSGQTSTNPSESSGAKRTARSPTSSDRSQIAQTRVTRCFEVTGDENIGKSSGFCLDLRFFPLLLERLDHLLRDVRRDFVVPHEVHRVVAAAAGQRRQ